MSLEILEVKVLKSAAGYYIGRMCIEDGMMIPYDRLMVGYFETREQCEKHLEENREDFEKRAATPDYYINHIYGQGL